MAAGVRFKADGQMECYRDQAPPGQGVAPIGWGSACTCVPAPMTSPASQSGIDTSTTAMYMCKSDSDFRSDGLEGTDLGTCSARNAAMLQRYGQASWHTITCDMVTGGTHKNAFYEHVSFGTYCCGSIADADFASTRGKVRCLDSSTMCKAAADFKPSNKQQQQTCLFWDGFLLSMFDGNKANWADVTCEELASTKYKNDVMDLKKDKMSDALGILANCCGGAEKVRCDVGSARVVVPSPASAVVAVFTAALAARLSP